MDCINCYINYSPVWRKGYCNACAMYYTRHGCYKSVGEIYGKILIDMSKNKEYCK